MARSTYSRGSFRRQKTVTWPQQQFNMLMILIIVCAAVQIGIFASFTLAQNQLQLPQPWIFPYAITVGCLTIFIVILLAIFSNNGKLTPGVLMVFAFVLLALYVTGMVGTAIQLFGAGRVSSKCNAYVNHNQLKGPNANTLAWLEQNNLCSSWYASFSFWIVGVLIYIWLFIFAIQVGQGAYDRGI